MVTAGSIIDSLGGTGQVAEALSLSASTVSTWRARGGIPGPHWAALVRLASEQNCPDVTFETLAELAAREPVEARA